MADVYNSAWSETDADNDSNTPDGWPEGQSPGTVNNCARAMMGALKRFINQQVPKTTTGTSTAYVLTYDVAPGSLADTMTFLVNFDQACGASPTLNVNSLGAKTLQKYVGSSWSDLAAGDIQADQILRVAYNSSSGKFRVISPLNVVPTGSEVGFQGTVDDVPGGWIIQDGGSIGDASSGGTNRAAADCQALFNILWANSNYSVQDSSGSASTKGATAAADWAAHKRLVLKDRSDTFTRGSSTASGGRGGSDTHTHTTSGSGSANTNAASHGTSVFASGGSGEATAFDHFHSFSVNVTGTAASTSNVPSYVYSLMLIKL